MITVILVDKETAQKLYKGCTVFIDNVLWIVETVTTNPAVCVIDDDFDVGIVHHHAVWAVVVLKSTNTQFLDDDKIFNY